MKKNWMKLRLVEPQSTWKSSLNRGENKKYLEPPPNELILSAPKKCPEKVRPFQKITLLKYPPVRGNEATVYESLVNHFVNMVGSAWLSIA